MDFHPYTTMRDWTRRADPEDRLAKDIDYFYKQAMADAVREGFRPVLRPDAQRTGLGEGTKALLQRLAVDHPDADPAEPRPGFRLIRLPLPALCIRFPKDTAKNPLKFDWKEEEIAVRCMLMGDMNQGRGFPS